MDTLTLYPAEVAMIDRIRRLGALAVLACVLAVFGGQSRGCLRELLDARAIQWSSLIVQGKLISIGTPQPMGSGTTHPTDWTCQIYTFQVSDVFDGPDTTGQVQVIRFIGPEETRSDPCGQDLDEKSLGKAFVLMLRPESQVSWSNQAGDIDPRTSQIHDLGAYLLVHLESSSDLGRDGLADLRRQIADTRAAEAQFSSDQARVQANTLATAADETEADQAEQALEAMGIKAAHIVREVQQGASDAAKARLQRVIDAIAVPAIVRSK
jgi:hypothetical protein